MSRYEQVCDMLRARRMAKKVVAKTKGWGYWNDTEYLAVIEDALIELGPLFAVDAENARLLMGTSPRGRSWDPEEYGMLIHVDETDWPLQSRHDA